MFLNSASQIITRMKLPDNHIEELIKELVGSDAIPLVMFIKDKHNISEFKIADKLQITINQVRNIIYRLGEYDLLSFTRKKDKEKGWYVYFWTLENVKLHYAIIGHKQRKIELLNNMLKEERTDNFLLCPKGCLRVRSEEALELQFKCPECDAVLKEENKEKRISFMETQKKKITEELDEMLAIAPKVKEPTEDKETVKKVPKKKVAKKPITTKIKPKKTSLPRNKLSLKKPKLQKKKQAPQKKPQPIPNPPQEKGGILRRVQKKLFNKH